MKTPLTLILPIMLALSACRTETFEASAALPENLTVTFTVQHAFGFQSDWTRQITIMHDGQVIQRELFMDTGWWRGSHLYRHKSGVYVIHEGPLGCFGFSLKPLSFNVRERISCKKRESPTREKDGASRYYADLVYLGAFTETSDPENQHPIRFISTDERAEIELPDII